MNALLLSVPVVVFALVVLFGFAGCWLDTEGKGQLPPQEDPPYVDNPTPPANYNEFIFASGPIAWWPLTDPADAPVAMDKVGSDVSEFGNHPGTYMGSVARGPVSLDDSAPGNMPTRFDGTGHIEVPHVQGDTTFVTPEFSVEALVLPDEFTAPVPSAGEPPVPDAYVVRNFSSSGGWALQVVPGGHATVGWFVARIWDSNGVESSVQLAYDLGSPVGSGWWVLMRFNGGTLWLNVNSDLDGTNGSYADNTTEPIQIGVGLHGALQDVAVYSRVLGQQEALDHMQASKTPSP
jgi:hypothetical protein